MRRIILVPPVCVGRARCRTGVSRGRRARRAARRRPARQAHLAGEDAARLDDGVAEGLGPGVLEDEDGLGVARSQPVGQLEDVLVGDERLDLVQHGGETGRIVFSPSSSNSMNVMSPSSSRVTKTPSMTVIVPLDVRRSSSGMIAPLNWLPGNLNTRTSTGPSAMVHLRFASCDTPGAVPGTCRRVRSTITGAASPGGRREPSSRAPVATFCPCSGGASQSPGSSSPWCWPPAGPPPPRTRHPPPVPRRRRPPWWAATR